MSPLFRVLRRAVWALAVVALLALVLTQEVGLVRTILFPLLALVLIVVDERGSLPRPQTIQTALTAACLLLSVWRLVIGSTPFLIVMADFLVAFLLIKGAFQKNEKDLRQMTALSFFVLLAAASLSINISFLAAFLVYAGGAAVTLSLFTLIGFEPAAPPEDRRPAPLLRALLRTAWVSVLSALTLAFLMFLFFPRWSAAVFQGTFLGPVRRTGYTDTVNLQGSGDIYRNPQVVMRVETDTPRWDGYLRGATMNRFDGHQWTSFKGTGTILRGPSRVENRFTLPGTSNAPGRTAPLFRQRIHLESLDTPVLFGAPWVRRIDVALPRVSVSRDGSLRRPIDHQGRLHYTVYSDPGFPGDAVEEWSLELGLSADERSRARKFTKNFFRLGDRPREKAAKLVRHFEENFTYTLEPPVSSGDPFSQFFFETRRGHCEHFASALALLLRLEGIPTRVVAGFRAHERNPDGGYWLVRAQDAHAWVEAHMEGRWVRWDPTPSTRFVLPEKNWANRWKERWDYVNFLWNTHVLSYDMESQRKLAVSAYRRTHRFDKARRGWASQWKTHRETSNRMGAIALAVLGGGALAWVGRVLLSHRGPKIEDISPSVWFYRSALALLSRAGFRRKEYETPQDLLQRFRANPGVSAPLRDLTTFYYRVRFGKSPLSATDTARTRNALEDLRRLLPKRG